MMLTRYVGRKSTEPLKKFLRVQLSLDREFRDLNEDFRGEPEVINNILQPLLHNGTFPSHIFNHAGIQEIITDHYHRHGKHQATLSMLISWGLAVNYFLHNDLSNVPPSIYTP
jgi:hypothetical protein